MFKQELYKISYNDVKTNKNLNDLYNYFLYKPIVLHNKHFSKQNIGINKKDLKSP